MARPSIMQAIATALAAHLRTQIPTATIEERWPEPGVALPAKAITVTLAGKVQYEPVNGEFIRCGDEVSPGIFRWSLKAVRQALQIDVWTTSDVELEDLLEQLGRATHSGLGITLGQINADPFRDGLLLPLVGFPSLCDYLFEDGPEVDESGERGIRREFRATQMCLASATYTVDAPTGKLALITLNQKLTESTATPDTTGETYHINASGIQPTTP